MACLPYPWWQGTKHTRASSPGYLLSYTWALPYLLLGKRLHLLLSSTPLETTTSNDTLGKSPPCHQGTVLTATIADCPPASRASHSFPVTLNVTFLAA